MSRRSYRWSSSTTGALAVAFVAAALALVLTNPLAKIRTAGGDKVTALVSNVGSLHPGNPVRVRGIEVGKVTDIVPANGGRAAKVTMSVYGYDDPIYADARADVRTRTVLGGYFYVDLKPGTPGGAELTGSIPVSHTSTQAEFEDVTSALGGDAKSGQRSILRNTAAGLRDPEAVRDTFHALAQAAPNIDVGLGALRGEQPGELRKLVRSSASTVRALDAPRDGLRRLVSSGATTLSATANRQSELQQSIAASPSTMRHARRTLVRTERTLNLLDPVVDALQPSAQPLDVTLAKARRLLRTADALLQDAQPALRRIRPAVSRLANVTRTGAPIIKSLTPSLNRLHDKILPELAKPDPVTKFSAYQLIGPTLSGFDSAAGQFDGGGHWIRFPAGPSERTVNTASCKTYLSDPEATQIATCESILTTLSRVLGGHP